LSAQFAKHLIATAAFILAVLLLGLGLVPALLCLALYGATLRAVAVWQRQQQPEKPVRRRRRPDWPTATAPAAPPQLDDEESYGWPRLERA
jgi:hypothetical protein